ncbi:Cytochrome P450 2S1 [Microtus ochrogaster]|uniref:Cytochrome P450 2S1 n=1 Tax=Microtus ochrogaster TaxID=79684 RepID=A0A8J6GMD9_MICOH|nr:Cytochrome P450 2S1 [Microtus ochrogaster]
MQPAWQKQLPGASHHPLLPFCPQLSKKYGPVFTVHLGPWRRVVVLVGHDAVREALGGQAEEFSGRGTLATLDKTFDGHGVFFANGERWKQLRKFTLLALRDLGMGKREGEELIQAEVQNLVEAFQKTEGRPFNPSVLLAQATSNVICSLIFGTRLPYEDKEFQAVIQAASGTLLAISSPWGQAYEMFSWLLQPLPGPHTQLQRHLGTLAAFAVQQVQRHQGSTHTSGPARDVVDAFLQKMAQEKQEPGTEFTEKNLLMTVTYLLFAGTMTVGATIRYALLLLMKYPQRVREELIQELGPGRAPSLSDRARLPYTDAVLHEAQRLLALVPMGMPHTLTRTTCFRGYTLPQGTEVFPLIGSVLHDPKVFQNPEEFHPDRFLDTDGHLRKHEAFLPFSLGKRVCLGEGLAKAELWLFFTAILQAFSLETPCPLGDLSLQPAVSGLFNIPPDFQLQLWPMGDQSR